MKPAVAHRDVKPANDDLVEVAYAPCPTARRRLVELVLEMLDARKKSGRG